MEWDLKTTSWDLSELEREAIPNIIPFDASGSFEGQNIKGDCSVDLKLGRLGDFRDGSVENWKIPIVSTVASSPSGSSKRARALSNGTHIASCLVEGCKEDLSNCREYHRRHKVCEVHSKTPTVIVGGQEQRFCQQCSRFHLLAEFDDVKRSCRKRLDGHNRRRRKPQPESLSMNSGSLFSAHRGTRLLAFNRPEIFTATPVLNPYPKSLSHSFEGSKRFPFLQDNDPMLGNQIISPESRGDRKMFSDGLTRVHDSECALSLLSSSATQNSEVDSSHMVQPNSIAMAQPLFPGLEYNYLGRYTCSQGIDDESGSSVLVNGGSEESLHCQGMFHGGHDRPSENEGSQSLPFSWW